MNKDLELSRKLSKVLKTKDEVEFKTVIYNLVFSVPEPEREKVTFQIIEYFIAEYCQPYLTTVEVAKLVKTNKYSVDEFVKKKGLRFYRPGRTKLISRSDLYIWLEKSKNRGKGEAFTDWN